MPARSALFPVPMIRVVASPSAIDALDVRDRALVVRVAPDELLVTRESAPLAAVSDPHAIVEDDEGFVHSVFSQWYLDEVIRPALEWEWHDERSPGQGMLHQIPIKLVRARDGFYALICHAAVADELEARLP